ncbi:hypothetical protein H311_00835 [Anncaliia algerae PRA109]|nr:hypothetical protein H311_00835 [Anncaliia algerae PRA109]
MIQRQNLSLINIESTISGWQLINAYNLCDKELDWIKNLSQTEVIEFLQATGIILCNKIRPDCNMTLTLLHYNATRNPFFRCSKRSCKRQRFSAFKNSIFEHSKLSIK